jgi:DNA-binding response OmpR family regulator
MHFNERRGLVFADVGLSKLELATLHVLVSHRGVPMSKEAIAAALPVPVEPRMIDVYVSRSRAKLAAAGLDEAITTVWGRGYMAGPAHDDASEEPPNTCDLDATLVPI